MGEITAVTSGRGGAGKTMFASNLAGILALQGSKVLVIDMNTGFRNLDICFGLESDIIFDLADVISGICPLKRAIVRDNRFPALYLLSAAPICGKSEIKPEHMSKICNTLKDSFDYIIIDTPGAVSDEWYSSVFMADKAVIIMTQEYSSLRSNDTIDRNLIELGVQKRYAILNKIKPKYVEDKHFPSFDEMTEATTAMLVGIVQEDEDIHFGMNCGLPIVCKEDSYITKNFIMLSKRLMT